MLTSAEILRYSRHILLPEVGRAGQERLRAASVLLVGMGGLGSPLALYLAAAGVGRLGLVDFDVVDVSNLQRQVIHGVSGVGTPKLQSARRAILELNPLVSVDLHEAALNSGNALEIIRGYDLVVDGADNFPTRYLVNDACVFLDKPDISGSVLRFEGQVSVFHASRGPCYRCLFPQPPPPGVMPSCGEAGVLGVLPGVIGTLQATEAVKLILGLGEPLIGRLLAYDALAMRVRELRVRKDPNCAVCGRQPTVTGLIDYQSFCGACSLPAAAGADEIGATELAARLRAGGELFLLDVRQPEEWETGRIPGAVLIPLDTLPARLGEIRHAAEIVVYCHSGYRSAKALKLLRAAGFTRVRHLPGGICAWNAAAAGQGGHA